MWDVGGPSGLSAVTPCFFTDGALYLLAWNLTLGEEAVAGLQTWLLNIEVSRAFPPPLGPPLGPRHPPP